jgi:hypothetical protein
MEVRVKIIIKLINKPLKLLLHKEIIKNMKKREKLLQMKKRKMRMITMKQKC